MKTTTLLSSLLIVSNPYSSAAEKKEQKPNIIFILTDDHNYELLGCNGNTIIQTPQFDKLAKEGVCFTNAHVSSAISTPSRACIFTGQYERKHGVNFNSGTSLSDEAWNESYPLELRNNGYYTGYIGKNHVPIGDGGYQSGLIEKSFDYWYGAMGHLGFYPKERANIFNGAKHDTQVEVLTEGILDFLDNNEYRLIGAEHFLNSRPKDKPFCLSICFNLPHDASTGTMKQLATDSIIYRSLYRDVNIKMPANYIAKKDIKTPKLPLSIHHVSDRQDGYNYVDEPATNKERLIRHMQAVTGIDGLLGKLREQLKAAKLDKNTIIIFTSDHGLFFGQQGLGGKATCYEQNTHVPMIIYNPMAPKSARGRINDELVQTIDIAPTMLTYAGVDIPKGMQGKDISGIIDGTKKEVRQYLYTENLWSTHFGNPRCESVQDKEWKYIRYYKNQNPSAVEEVKNAKILGLKVNEIMYSVHDPAIVLYRSFIEGPVNNEEPVYEELYHLTVDPQELHNVISDNNNKPILGTLKNQWSIFIKEARGTEKPKVLRYTADYMQERYGAIKNE